MEIKLHPSQYEFITDTETRYLAFVGGLGSGKTFALIMKIIDMARLNVGYNVLGLEPTNNLLATILIPEMITILDAMGIRYELYTSASSNARFILYFQEGESTVYLRSAENWKRIVGFQVAAIVCDEIDTIDPKIMELVMPRLQARLRGHSPVKQIAFCSTPEGFKFLYDFFVLKKKKGKRLIKASTYENIDNVGADYIEEMKLQYSPSLLKAYLHGEFVNLMASTVYSNYDATLNDTSRQYSDCVGNVILHIGIDFNVGQTVGIVSVIENGLPVIINEITKCKDTPDLIRKIKALYPDNVVMVYPDASGGARKSVNSSITDLTLLKHAGFKVKAGGVNPRIVDRINNVQAMFLNAAGDRRLLVNQHTCPELCQSLLTQPYDLKTNLPDKGNNLDHCVDALGYLINYNYRIKRRR